MLSSRFQIRALLGTQKTSTKATLWVTKTHSCCGLSQAAAAEDQQLQVDLVGEIKIPHPAKTLGTSQSYRASSWLEEHGHGMDAQQELAEDTWWALQQEPPAPHSTGSALITGGLRNVPGEQILQSLSHSQVPAAQQRRAGARGARSAPSN